MKGTVIRTVTNVANTTSTYKVKISAPKEVQVHVSPSRFTIAPGKRLRYKVTVVVKQRFGMFKFGSLTWVDDKGHSVRSVLALHCKQSCWYWC
ncbi:hypothetical protein CLOP_g2739 [Closterium sp. NIES-67]|nr:hypothetical protein CLOP_g2739 [Closterium sp. NIES-67]